MNILFWALISAAVILFAELCFQLVRLLCGDEE